MSGCEDGGRVFQSAYDMNLYADPPRRLSKQLERELAVEEDRRGSVYFSLNALWNAMHPSEFCPLLVELFSAACGKPAGPVLRNVYLALIVSKCERDESVLLVFDKVLSNVTALRIRYMVPLWSDTQLELTGDGSFQLRSGNQHATLTLPSVRSLWTVTTALDRARQNAAKHNYYMGGPTHKWLSWYRQFVASSASPFPQVLTVPSSPMVTPPVGMVNVWSSPCLLTDLLESNRLPSRLRPQQLRRGPSAPGVPPVSELRECPETSPTPPPPKEKDLENALRRVMLEMDLDQLTCGQIRRELEQIFQQDLTAYRKFLDAKMLMVLGQMEVSSEIFDQFLFLGTEWNASNRDELEDRHIGYILNMAQEIDVFFPGLYNYCHVRIFDDVDVDIYSYLDLAVQFIEDAKMAGSRVLVHCQMGVSRSASAVIAYGMKAYGWSLDQSFAHVKRRRHCVQPNQGFMEQLKAYEAALRARAHTFLSHAAHPIDIAAS